MSRVSLNYLVLSGVDAETIERIDTDKSMTVTCQGRVFYCLSPLFLDEVLTGIYKLEFLEI